MILRDGTRPQPEGTPTEGLRGREDVGSVPGPEVLPIHSSLGSLDQLGPLHTPHRAPEELLFPKKVGGVENLSYSQTDYGPH